MMKRSATIATTMVKYMEPKPTGSKRTASAAQNGKLSAATRRRRRVYPYLALCIQNESNAGSLERGKAYRVIKPLPADPPGRLRVLDEEQEDYLYPSDWFVPIRIASAAQKRVLQALN
jgi:hypothetical protein